MRIHDLDPESRPREKFLLYGAGSLNPAELLAIILRSGSKNLNIIDTCNELIAVYGLERLAELPIAELQKIRGIGQAKAMQIAALFELNKRVQCRRNDRKKIRRAKDVFDYMQGRIPDETKEHLFVLHLNTKNIVLRHETVSVGTLNTSLIHPREVFKSAIRESAHALILIHNHPSGDVEPSPADRKVTEMLRQAGTILQIELLDHVIVGKENWFSFREHSLLE